MKRANLKELLYITPIQNVPSILELGLLSHSGAKAIAHESIAMEEVLDRRKSRVPGGRPLQEYVNLYLCARNPMLYKRRNRHEDLCVLRVSESALDIQGAVVADGNAASDYTRYAPSPQGLRIVDEARTFADFWTDEDFIEYLRKKRAKCAELLVPDGVPPDLIEGAYVSSASPRLKLASLAPGIGTTIDGDLFFR